MRTLLGIEWLVESRRAPKSLAQTTAPETAAGQVN
jgi:hypothetical protein